MMLCCRVLLGPVFMLILSMRTESFSIFSPEPSTLRPVILIPGKGGNQIEGYLDKSFRFRQDMTGYRCPPYKKWFRLWLDIWRLLPSSQLCFSDVMELEYNLEKRVSTNQQGVSTQIPGFGDTQTMEYVDPSWTAWCFGTGKYFAPFVDQLISIGYERKKNLFGAPYDFRLLPHSQKEYFDKLKYLIEKAYYLNNRERVVLMAHSMGGLFATYFLQHMKPEWKNKYIHNFVAVNTPWAGAPVILGMLISGYDFEDTSETINAVAMRKHQRSFETIFYLLPRAPVWTDNDVVVVTPEANYTVEMIPELFERINHTEASPIMEDLTAYSLEHPGVDVFCWFSTLDTLKTPETSVYREGEFPDLPPTHVYGEGDGTVPLRSLKYCQTVWGESSEVSADRLHTKHFQGREHVGIFESKEFFLEFKSLVQIPEYK